MMLSSTSPYGLLKEFYIACGVSYDAVFRSCSNMFVQDCSLSCYFNFQIPLLTADIIIGSTIFSPYA